MADRRPRARSAAWRQGLTPFESRNFRLWFASQTVSQIGYFMQTVALALLIIDLTDDGSLLGLSALAHYLPIVILAPWAGVLCDRIDKRRLLIASQVVLMLAAFGLGLITLVGAGFPAVMAVATLTGVASGIDHPARRTIVVELVEPADEASAVSLNTMISNCAKLVGPSVAAVVVALVGTAWCFILNGLTFVAVIGALQRMDPRAMRPAPLVERVKGQIREGIAYVAGEPALRSTTVLLSVEAMLIFNWNILLPLFVERELQGSKAALALTMGTMSVGALCGSLWIARRPVTDLRSLGWFAVAVGTGHLLVSMSPSLSIGAVFCLGTGAAAMLLFNAGQVGLQLGAAPAMRGRVMAIFGMFFLGGIAVGGPTFGWIAEHASTRTAIASAGIAAGTAGAIALASHRRAAIPAPSTPQPPDRPFVTEPIVAEPIVAVSVER